MNTTNRIYESLYIIDAALTDDQVESIISKYSKVVTDQGGEVQAAGKWDKRRLAYDIGGHRDGIYILMYFTGDPAVAGELDRLFKITDDVFRHIIVRVEQQHVDTSRIDHPQQPAEPAAEAAAEPAKTAETTEEEGAEQPAEQPAVESAEETTAEPEPAEQVIEEPAEEAAETAPEVTAEPEPAEETAVSEEPAAEEALKETEAEEPNVESEKDS